MAGPPSGQPTGPSDALNRRRWLQLAGVAALTVGGCATGSSQPTLPPDDTGVPTTVVPPSTPGASAAPAPVGTSAAVLCRDGWGARPARTGGRPHRITRMTIHHTEVVLGENRNAPARLRQHQRYHQNERGWIDIAYHVGVDRNGNIYELRTPALAGDTATSYDPTGHFLVLCEGDFDREPVSEAQLNGAALVLAWAAQTFHIGSDTIAGHRDFAATTTCPGAHLYDRVVSGDLKRRIDDLLVVGAVNLQPVCGPQAAARVADIEEGR